MKPARRQFLRLAAAAAALPAATRVARANPYPTRSPHIVVGVPPGGTFDIVARLVGQGLSERLGQPFIIDNRPGAGTNIGTDAVVHAAPDGYTLLLAGSPAAINATLYDNLGFDFIRDIAPVASIERSPLLMVVNPALPAVTVAQFIAYAAAHPGAVNMGSGGVGATGHVAGELFAMMAGVTLSHVPYRGEVPALTDLLGGQVQVAFATAGSVIPYVKSGALRALAITSTTRLAAVPDVPPLADDLPGYEASAWTGIAAPRGTPADIVATLNREINAALADPKMQAQLATIGATVLTGTPADFGRLIADETEKWGKVVRAAHIRAG